MVIWGIGLDDLFIKMSKSKGGRGGGGWYGGENRICGGS